MTTSPGEVRARRPQAHEALMLQLQKDGRFPTFRDVLLFAAAVGFAIIFGTRRFYSTRFIYPGIVAIAFFVAFPVVYTVVLGFTNFSSLNLLTFERAQGVIMQARTIDKATERPFALTRDGAAYRVFLPEGEGGGGLLSDPVPLDGNPVTVPATPVDVAPEAMATFDYVPAKIVTDKSSRRHHIDLFPRVLADIADVEIAGHAIEAPPPGVAQTDAPHVDVGWCGHVAGGPLVRLVDIDAQHLARARVGPLPGFVGITTTATVARSRVQHAVGAESDHAAVVVAPFTVRHRRQDRERALGHVRIGPRHLARAQCTRPPRGGGGWYGRWHRRHLPRPIGWRRDGDRDSLSARLRGRGAHPGPDRLHRRVQRLWLLRGLGANLRRATRAGLR